MALKSIKKISWLPVLSLLAVAPQAVAIDHSITIASDYLYNGVTQTDGKPALQYEGVIEFDNGWYVGAFASNVDFGDDTWLEIDGFAGRYWQVSEQLGIELGGLYYSYHGENADSNYLEFTAAAYLNQWRFQLWYAPDYAGTEAGHVIVEGAYTLYTTDVGEWSVGVNWSVSQDEARFTWGPDQDYQNVWLDYGHGVGDWLLAAKLSHATLDSDLGGGTALVVSATRSF